jgi:hypothetical protein
MPRKVDKITAGGDKYRNRQSRNSVCCCVSSAGAQLSSKVCLGIGRYRR